MLQEPTEHLLSIEPGDGYVEFTGNTRIDHTGESRFTCSCGRDTGYVPDAEATEAASAHWEYATTRR
jgi:hypothetical protein